jgi:hypothetical protein
MAKKTVSNTKPATPVAPAKRAVKPAAKNKIITEPKAIKPVAAKPKRVAQPKAPAYTFDDIALRAYFIAEKRRSLGLPGDEHQDWVDAEQQLATESKSRKKTKAA